MTTTLMVVAAVYAGVFTAVLVVLLLFRGGAIADDRGPRPGRRLRVVADDDER